MKWPLAVTAAAAQLIFSFGGAATDIPTDWVAAVASSDAFFSPDDAVEVAQYLPLIGNGYLAHSDGVRGDSYYIAGIYNGDATATPSHRARIPATFAVTVNDATTTGALLDVRRGTYFRRGNFSEREGAWYELQWYAHMSRRSVYVLELRAYLPNGASAEELVVQLTNHGGADSDDINFKQTVVNTTAGPAILQCGDTKQPETPDSSVVHICMASSNISSPIELNSASSGGTNTFITAIRTSLDTKDPDLEVVADFEAAMTAAAKLTLQKEHTDAWSVLWQGGSVELGGSRSDIAAAVNVSLFAMLSSTRSDWPYGLAPGGLSNGYNGHSFWDTETWMFPPLLLLNQPIAAALLKYRSNRLPGAYIKAQSYSPPYEGAMFPWESAFTGVETCPEWADTGLREQHISADIALATWQYWCASGDIDWLQSVGFPLLQGIADFYVSRVQLDASNGAHINEVIPPDEYVSSCNDSVYTNFAAASALRFAAAAGDALNVNYDPQYLEVAESLVVLYDEQLQLHPEYDGYSGDLIKQADVVLLSYPWALQMPDMVRANDLHYYSSRTDTNGPAMTWGMHSIGYKDLGNFSAAATYFNMSFQNNVKTPFNVWTETPEGGALNFITGAGGFLQTVLAGYAGLRFDTEQQMLRISSPACPEGVTSVLIRGVEYHGFVLQISYTCHNAATDDVSCGSVASYLTMNMLSSRPQHATGEIVVDYGEDERIALYEGAAVELPVRCHQGVGSSITIRHRTI